MRNTSTTELSASDFERERDEYLGMLLQELLPLAQYKTKDFHYAEDLVSITAVKVSLNYETLRAIPENERRTWVNRVFNNALNDFYRSKGKLREMNTDYVADLPYNTINSQTTDFEKKLLQMEEIREIDEYAEKNLTRAQYDLYKKCFKEGMLTEDYAKERGKSPETVRAIKYKVREKLRARFKRRKAR